jgi:hypothetical protein
MKSTEQCQWTSAMKGGMNDWMNEMESAYYVDMDNGHLAEVDVGMQGYACNSFPNFLSSCCMQVLVPSAYRPPAFI